MQYHTNTKQKHTKQQNLFNSKSKTHVKTFLQLNTFHILDK